MITFIPLIILMQPHENNGGIFFDWQHLTANVAIQSAPLKLGSSMILLLAQRSKSCGLLDLPGYSSMNHKF